MTATQHTHNWRRLSGYNRNEWRCTSADKASSILEPDFEEHGCLGTLVYWPRRRLYVFCAPGTHIMELDQRPVAMLIDRDYLDKAASFAESLRRLAA